MIKHLNYLEQHHQNQSLGELQANIGLNNSEKKQLGGILLQNLVHNFFLGQHVLSAHWNIKGIHFQALHEFLGEYYQNLIEVSDELAERLRALGFYVPVDAVAWFELANADLQKNVFSNEAQALLSDLLIKHESMIRELRSNFAVLDQINDPATADLLTEKLDFYEKNAWKIRSML